MNKSFLDIVWTFRVKIEWSSTTEHKASGENQERFLWVFTFSNSNKSSWGSTRCVGFVHRCFMPRIKSKLGIWSHWIWFIWNKGLLSHHCIAWMRRRKETTLVCSTILSQWTWTRRYRQRCDRSCVVSEQGNSKQFSLNNKKKHETYIEV
jgi:hypothetical protein